MLTDWFDNFATSSFLSTSKFVFMGSLASAVICLMVTTSVTQARDCTQGTKLIESDGESVATIMETYDCWHEQGKNTCLEMSEVPGRLTLSGYRTYRVHFDGVDFAFTQTLQREDSQYVIGGFLWNPDDVAGFRRVTDWKASIGAGDQIFDFRQSWTLNRVFSLPIPDALVGKMFAFSACDD